MNRIRWAPQFFVAIAIFAFAPRALARDLEDPLPPDLARRVAESVDLVAIPLLPDERKLLRERALLPYSIDSCTLADTELSRDTGLTFFTAIRHGIRRAMAPRKIFSDPYIDRAYGLPGRDKSRPVGLMSHPLCSFDAVSAESILGAGFVPEPLAIEQLNRFVELSNRRRAEAKAGSRIAQQKFELQWSTLFSCLAYKESLTDAEASPELDTAYLEYLEKFPEVKSHLHSLGLISRPRGVHFGFDHPGEYYIRKRAIRADTTISEEERQRQLDELEKDFGEWDALKWVVAGLFQFTPETSGNIIPCVNQWNDELRKVCPIEKTLPKLTAALVSPLQSFNAYCGVQKVVQGFNSQVNTINRTGVHPANVIDDRILSPRNRCVSLLMRGGTGRMYTHFGPLRNSTQRNFSALINCTSLSLVPELQE